MAKTIREIVAEKLKGFEYRQEARNRARAAETRARQKHSMLNQYGTLKGARQYLHLKGIQFFETTDPSNGHVQVTVPSQVVLSYDAEGRYLGSGPHRVSGR